MAEQSKRLPLTVQAAYSDLIARLQEDAVLDLGGTPLSRERAGRKYWYAVQRLGNVTVERYLGPDTDELRKNVERSLKINADLRERETQRSRLVRMCREGGILGADVETGKVLFALSKAGIFRLRAVIVGTHAFRCYPGLLGTELPEAYDVTEDIDLAGFHSIAIAVDDHLDPGMADALRQVGPFIARPSLFRHATAWRNRESGVLVELLTPNEGPDRDEPVELPALGAYAQPMRFLDYLIHKPVQAAALYRSGVLVNVPQPSRYAVHKLIVAIRRDASAATKAMKDIDQSAALIDVLAEDRPDELEEALVEARERGPAWREAIDQGARRLPAETRNKLMNLLGSSSKGA